MSGNSRSAGVTGGIDRRFSNPEAEATPWAETERALAEAELYWITTVRADGRPHVTPLVGAWRDGAMHFCTGLDEQKARNIEGNEHVALTTGNNAWESGLDVVVEGTAARIVEPGVLQAIADAYEAKYGSAWHFDVDDDGFRSGETVAGVFRVEPAKVIAFAKDPHGQTTYRFAEG